MRASRPLALGVVALVGVTAPLLTGDGASAAAPMTRVTPAAAPPQAAAAAVTPQSLAAAAYARMTQAQRIGQLFMVGGAVSGPRFRDHDGRVDLPRRATSILTGRTTAGPNPCAPSPPGWTR